MITSLFVSKCVMYKKKRKETFRVKNFFYFVEVSTHIDVNMIYIDIYCQTQQ